MPCPPICVRETVSRDPEVSPGVVGSNEQIYRALFPSQRKAGVIKKSAITASHLWSGQLSVWRLGEVVALELDQLIEFLEPRMVRSNGEKFDLLCAASVAVIRAYEVNEERGFSVLDECDLDDAGNKHGAHAHIAICERLKAKISRDDETFAGLQEWLKLLFEKRPPAWQRA